MQNRLLAIAAIAGVMAAPIAAQAQSGTVGVVGGGSVVVGEHEANHHHPTTPGVPGICRA